MQYGINLNDHEQKKQLTCYRSIFIVYFDTLITAWEPLDSITKKRAIEEFNCLRYRSGAYNNWLLAAEINEAFLLSVGEVPEPMRIGQGQVRCALTAVMHRMFDVCNNFDANGWLILGFCEHQPQIADYYTSTGNLYMTTLSFKKGAFQKKATF